MSSISNITARQILDSRGRPTVETTVTLSDGTTASSSVPSGTVSQEKFEAVELRDNNPQEYFGFGVSQAVNNVNGPIRQTLMGKDPLYQTQIDQTLVDLDGTKNKSKLGANAILSVSQAVMKTAAASLRLPLFVYVKEKYKLIDAYRIPTPIFNLMNGGRHSSGTLDFQEFQLVPASHLTYPQSLRIGIEMYMAIEKILQQKGALTTVGLEGGFSPNLASNADALEIFNEAAKLTTYTLSQDAFLGIDVGPAWFHKSGKYVIRDRPQPMATKEFIKYLRDLHEQYRVFAFEDPLMPDDWSDWKALTADLGDTAMIVADDLVTTNKTLLMKAIQEQACNAVVIKPNRIGTITEAIEIVSLAKQAGWHTIMSHRSSDTTDDFLADVAVGIGTDYVKFGAPSRGERVVKYNRLLRIEEILRASQTGPEAAAPFIQTSPTPQKIQNSLGGFMNQDDSSLASGGVPTGGATGSAPTDTTTPMGMPSSPPPMPDMGGATPTPTPVPSMPEINIPAMPSSTPAAPLSPTPTPAPMPSMPPSPPAPSSSPEPTLEIPAAPGGMMPPAPTPTPDPMTPPPAGASAFGSAPTPTETPSMPFGAPPSSTPAANPTMPSPSMDSPAAPETDSAQASLNELAQMVQPGMVPPASSPAPVTPPSMDTAPALAGDSMMNVATGNGSNGADSGLPKPVPPAFISGNGSDSNQSGQ